jgi:hypothetical protein
MTASIALKHENEWFSGYRARALVLVLGIARLRVGQATLPTKGTAAGSDHCY